jgi:uncharacterized membrane protein YphA (DoxX/SURF4 family)
MDVAVWIAAGILAATFAWAAIGKFVDRNGTRTATQALGVPAPYATPIAAALPVVEILAAGLILLPPFRIVGALGCLGLLLAFSFAIARTLRAGEAPRCHCFGSRSAQPIDRSLLTRNAALALLAFVVLVGR